MYHRFYVDLSDTSVLHVTTNGLELNDQSMMDIGHSKYLSWLERLLEKGAVPIEKVIYPLPIDKIQKMLVSESTKEYLDCSLGPIKPGQLLKLRVVYFNPTYPKDISQPKLILFHDFPNMQETDSLLRPYISDLQGSECVGRILAQAFEFKEVRLTPYPFQEQVVDKSVHEAIDQLNASAPRWTIGDILRTLPKNASGRG